MNTTNDTRPLARRPRASSSSAIAAWVEAMVAADVAAQVSLGLPESLVPEVTRGLTVDLLAGISAHLGLRIVALADGEAAT